MLCIRCKKVDAGSEMRCSACKAALAEVADNKKKATEAAAARRRQTAKPKAVSQPEPAEDDWAFLGELGASAVRVRSFDVFGGTAEIHHLTSKEGAARTTLFVAHGRQS